MIKSKENQKAKLLKLIKNKKCFVIQRWYDFCNKKHNDRFYIDLSNMFFSFVEIKLSAKIFFKDSKFYNSKFYNSEFYNSEFYNSEFYNSKFKYSEFKYSKFYNSKFYNSKFYNSKFYNSKFYNSKFYNSEFYNSEFYNSKFYNSEFYNSEFYNSKFKDSEFKYSEFKDSNTFDTTWNGCKGIESNIDILKKYFKFSDKGLICYKGIINTIHNIPDYWIIQEGAEITEVCNMNIDVECGSGVNVATKEWIKKYFPNSVIWECLIEWEWLVGICVPRNTDGKIRCEKLRLIKRIL